MKSFQNVLQGMGSGGVAAFSNHLRVPVDESIRIMGLLGRPGARAFKVARALAMQASTCLVVRTTVQAPNHLLPLRVNASSGAESGSRHAAASRPSSSPVHSGSGNT